MAKRRPSGDGMVRKLESGRWQGRIVVGHKDNGDPIFRYAYGATQKEMTGKLHQLIGAYQGADLTEASNMTLGEWLDQWLEKYAATTVRESTLSGYRRYAEQYIGPILGHKRISQITTTDVQRMYIKLKKEGRIHEHPEFGKELSDTTIRRIHSMLHLAMNVAKKEHLIHKNPTEGTTVPKRDQKPKKILTNEQMDIFMKAIEADEPWYDFFYTELTTGLRRGEICGLQWQDFDEEKGTLKISRTLHYQREGEYSTGETKTGKGKRTIILPRSTADLLRRRKQNALSQWIFHHPVKPEHPTSPHYAYVHLKTLLNKAGLPDIRFHDLRHTFATAALENGMDVKTLSAIIGHTSAATTLDIYTHITDTMQEEAAASIDRGIGKSTEAEERIERPQKPTEEFQPVKSHRRKPGTGCVTQINDRLWEGRYSPKWIDGKKRSRNVYAHTREECEEKLVVLIREMKAELAQLKAQAV